MTDFLCGICENHKMECRTRVNYCWIIGIDLNYIERSPLFEGLWNLSCTREYWLHYSLQNGAVGSTSWHTKRPLKVVSVGWRMGNPSSHNRMIGKQKLPNGFVYVLILKMHRSVWFRMIGCKTHAPTFGVDLLQNRL